MTDTRTAEQQAADVRTYRLSQAQAAREKRGEGQIIEAGVPVPYRKDPCSLVRPGIAHSTRQARKQRGQEAGRELQKRRWVETQMGGKR